MLEDLDTFLPRRRDGGCKVSKLMSTLSDSDQDILEAALKDTAKWTTNALHIALRQKGLDIGYQIIYRHRKESCRCFDA